MCVFAYVCVFVPSGCNAKPERRQTQVECPTRHMGITAMSQTRERESFWGLWVVGGWGELRRVNQMQAKLYAVRMLRAMMTATTTTTTTFASALMRMRCYMCAIYVVGSGGCVCVCGVRIGVMVERLVVEVVVMVRCGLHCGLLSLTHLERCLRWLFDWLVLEAAVVVTREDIALRLCVCFDGRLVFRRRCSRRTGT